MFNIQEYLQKFRRLTSHESEVRDIVLTVLNEECGLSIDRDTVEYRNKRVFIRAHPLVKNEIATHKPAIRAKIRARANCVIHDIL